MERLNAMLAELQLMLQQAQTRAVLLAGENAELKVSNAALAAQIGRLARPSAPDTSDAPADSPPSALN